MMKQLCTLIVLALFVSGCTTMRSTSLTRRDDGSFDQNELPHKGVPVTVKVPSHLELALVETIYLHDANGESDILDLQPIPGFRSGQNIKVISKLIKTDKVITVDWKRPAAGVLEYNLDFDSENQYIDKYESFLFDRTLEDTANLISSIIPGVNKQSKSNDPSPSFAFRTSAGSRPDANNDGIGKNLKKLVMVRESVVAIAQFDIHACDFEQRVAAFLNHHLNSCHNCSLEAIR